METILPPSSPEAEFAKRMVASGAYSDERELIAAGVRLLQRREQRRQEILGLLEDGRRSGVAEPESLASRRARLHAEAAKRGVL